MAAHRSGGESLAAVPPLGSDERFFTFSGSKATDLKRQTSVIQTELGLNFSGIDLRELTAQTMT
jgi:hypothetical protein